ncbi:DNA-binding response regulator [Poseidonocella sp. HB161398]|uniref:response regulator transcription factor n=1 Tax=Poseidonocella sp. HB161398 TaxID=2320855 RepID=UPI001109B2DD|nr:DNA-binding response regulator [Poseidonocella sp. HB161398]
MTPLAANRPSIALIVDDDPGSVRMVSTALEESGTTVLVARNGEAAIELVRRISPDVILMDAMMPGIDGFETCRRLKAPPLMIEAPIIFMTGLSGTEDIRRGLAAGGVDYVSKPVRVDEVIARVTVHTVNARQLSAARAALDSGGRSIFVSDAAGRVSWATPLAREALTAGGALTVSQAIGDAEMSGWIGSLAGRAVSEVAAFERPGGRCEFMGTTADGQFLIRFLAEPRLGRRETLAQRFDLTQREAEVLLWLTRGKTNKDIAEILELSARTVNKHLEQVFQKMGVDNRTAAALLADRAISGL